MKNSRVAFNGAVPMPSTTETSLPLSLIRIGTSPPKEKCENSITDAARIVATPASTALPPCRRIRNPASTDSGLPPATTPRLPRTTGRNVSAVVVGGGSTARITATHVKQIENAGRFDIRMMVSSVGWFPQEGSDAFLCRFTVGVNRVRVESSGSFTTVSTPEDQEVPYTEPGAV